jgi:hypothetical protein
MVVVELAAAVVVMKRSVEDGEDKSQVKEGFRNGGASCKQ